MAQVLGQSSVTITHVEKNMSQKARRMLEIPRAAVFAVATCSGCELPIRETSQCAAAPHSLHPFVADQTQSERESEHRHWPHNNVVRPVFVPRRKLQRQSLRGLRIIAL